jgi:hypothetical protein
VAFIEVDFPPVVTSSFVNVKEKVFRIVYRGDHINISSASKDFWNIASIILLYKAQWFNPNFEEAPFGCVDTCFELGLLETA